MNASCWIAVVGGDGRVADELLTRGFFVRRFCSGRDSGRGDLCRLRSALAQGSVGRVIVLARWFGHSDYRWLRFACRRRQIALHVVRGGASEAARILREAA